jgi:flagellar biosynthesis protein FliR
MAFIATPLPFQVSFSLAIPATLIVSTTQTLSSSQGATSAAVLAIALLQVLLGAVLGKLAGAAVEGKADH